MTETDYVLLATSTNSTIDLEDTDLESGDTLLAVQATDGTDVSEYSDAVVYSQEDSRYVISKTTLTAIADSVRAKTGKTGLIPAEDISTEIDSLYVGQAPTGTTPTITSNGEHDVAGYAIADVQVPIPDGYIVPADTISITENGTHDVTAYASADVNVPIPAEYKKMDSVVKDITTNGLHSTVKDADTFYGVVNVNVEGASEPVLQEKTATENGEVLPDEGYDGLSKVIVDIDVDVPTPLLVEETFTENGEYTPAAGIDGYSKVTVDLTLPSEYDGVVETPVQIRYPYGYRFYEAPDVSIDMTNNMLFFDGAVEWNAIRVDKTNEAIYFINTTNDSMRTIYTAADGWDATDDMARYFSVSSFGAEYYPDKYTFRGWFASNTYRILPEYRFSYDGGEYTIIEPGRSITIPCEGKVMKTDIVIYDATTNEE